MNSEITFHLQAAQGHLAAAGQGLPEECREAWLTAVFQVGFLAGRLAGLRPEPAADSGIGSSRSDSSVGQYIYGCAGAAGRATRPTPGAGNQGKASPENKGAGL